MLAEKLWNMCINRNQQTYYYEAGLDHDGVSFDFHFLTTMKVDFKCLVLCFCFFFNHFIWFQSDSTSNHRLQSLYIMLEVVCRTHFNKYRYWTVWADRGIGLTVESFEFYSISQEIHTLNSLI